MSQERYVISERSGRLKKKIRVRRKHSVPIWKQMLRMVKKPWVVSLFIMALIGIVYRSMDAVGKKSSKSPVKNAVDLNNRVREKTGQ